MREPPLFPRGNDGADFPAQPVCHEFRRRRYQMLACDLSWAGTALYRTPQGLDRQHRPAGRLEIKFPTLEAAIRYARRQALDVKVDGTLAPGALPAWPLHESGAPTVDQKHAA